MLPRSATQGVLFWGLPFCAGALALLAWRNQSWPSMPMLIGVLAASLGGGALWGWAASVHRRRREQERTIAAFGLGTGARQKPAAHASTMGLLLVPMGLVILMLAVHGVIAGSDHYTSIGLAVVLVAMGLAHLGRQPPRLLVRASIALAALANAVLRILK